MRRLVLPILIIGLAAGLHAGCGAAPDPAAGPGNMTAVLAKVVTAADGSSDSLTGAIFTTTADGLTVNGNVYENCCDVYLNGGPGPKAPCTAAGLPDGLYLFQVTDPSGKVLLSTEAIFLQRVFRVAGGVIVEYLGTSTPPCDHVTSTGPCDGVTIQLMPFHQTPNPGNEYKVWVTPFADFDPSNPHGSFGFVDSTSKTDNFKCKQEEQVCAPMRCLLNTPPCTPGEIIGAVVGGTAPWTCEASFDKLGWVVTSCTTSGEQLIIDFQQPADCMGSAVLTVVVTDAVGCQTTCMATVQCTVSATPCR